MCQEKAAEAPGASGDGDPLELERFFSEARQRAKHSDFDCVVGISGGRDSTYLAYMLRRKHNLRCLAVYYRTVFTPEITDQNVRRTASILGMPLMEIRTIPWAMHLKVARDYCLLWKKSPLAAIANLTCAPCKLVNGELVRIAHRNRVPALILGGNKMETLPFIPTYSKKKEPYSALEGQIRNLGRMTTKGLGLALKHPGALRHGIVGAKAALLYLSPLSAYLQLRYPDVRRIQYFFHAPWIESEVDRVIRDELGWELTPDTRGTWKADCEFVEMKQYMFHKMFGVTYTDGLLSNLIRSGQLTRQQALARVEGQTIYSEPRMERAVKRLGLPDDFLDRSLSVWKQ